MDSRRTVFYSIAAQSDNLGDIEIRKVVLDWLRESGCVVAIFAGGMPADYIDAFEIAPGTPLQRSSSRFQLEMIRSALTRRAHLVFAPGPQSFGPEGGAGLFAIEHWKRPLTNLGNTLIVRIGGGRSLALGRAIRGRGKAPRFVERARVRSLNLFTARDSESSKQLRMQLRVAPDLAFYNVGPAKRLQDRTKMIISLRGDREANRDALAGAIQCARRHDLEPIFLTQVRSDDRQHCELAAAMGCAAVLWDDETSHSQQLVTIKQIYREARVVISDRLHALIFGAQQGAIPVAIIHPNNDKLTSTLRSVVPLVEVGSDEPEWHQIDATIADEELGERVHQSAVAARRALETLKGDVLGLLRDQQTASGYESLADS